MKVCGVFWSASSHWVFCEFSQVCLFFLVHLFCLQVLLLCVILFMIGKFLELRWFLYG